MENLSKSELLQIISKQSENVAALTKQVKQLIDVNKQLIERNKPVPAPRTKKSMKRPIPAPRKNVKQMIKEYEENIITPIPPPRTKIMQVNKALKGFTESYEVTVIDDKDPLVQLQKTRQKLGFYIKNILESMKGLKFIETLKVTFEKTTGDIIISKTAYFNSKAQTIINQTEIAEALKLTAEQILNRIAQWISEGSGWIIKSIDNHYLNIVRYKPMKGSSYLKLPIELQNKKGLINLQNKDNECFRWCHVRHLCPMDKDPQRIKKSDRKYVSKLNYDGVVFPVSIKQINKIELQNKININVFGYENKQPYPLFVSKEKFEDHMELLLISENENKHFVYIKDFNRFMFNQTKHKNKKHFCMHCLQCFSTKDVFDVHKKNCIVINGTQAIKMPSKDNNILKYNHYHKQLPAPFVIYADFEALTERIHGCQQNNDKSFTDAYQKHTDCGYGYKVVCCYDDKYTKDVQYYRGENAVYKFLEKMLEEVSYCKNIIKQKFNKPLKMTNVDEEQFKKADKCHICGILYNDKDIRVRDHCHITGLFRGSAHQDCNLSFKLTGKIPVVFHNLRGYHSHFIMQQIGEIVKKHTYVNGKGEECQMNVNAIPNNMEKYMAVMLGNSLVFIDSFQFMSQSLANLVNNLPKDALKYTREFFKKDKYFNLMTKKGVYPYDYMDSFDKFKMTELPSKEEFYSQLNDEHISDKQYDHAKKVWKTFKVENMGVYHDLYLASDVILLADVFENFRKTCLEYYKLDPCHYFTSPGLSWDAMLKMTGIKLELMTDIDMFQFIEKGLRGGISYIANRYGKANNPYMKEYDEKEPSSYIMYLDANNLYGWAMSQYLPTGGFKWMSQSKIDELDLAKYDSSSKKGLILEVDLDYPTSLHDLHNDFPLAPEQVCVKENMLSNYCSTIKEKYNISIGQVHKLIPTLSEKRNYVLHYRNLHLYLDLGLKITKVHRVLEFDQSPWLKQYIDFNTLKRTNSKNSFEKDFFKLMNNSVFGKTMENLRKRVDVRLVTDEKKLVQLTSKPTYVSSKIFNENLVAVHKIKETLTLNRPAYVGMCILDISKTLIYDFHYNYIKSKYGNRAKLLFTDTDSLTYEIQTEDSYKDFWNDKDKFDNSDYPADSPFYDASNKKVMGKFKDEAAGKPITEFIGLRSKMYSYTKDDGINNKTAKGIAKNVIKKVIKHEDYKNILFNNEQMYHNMKTIRSDLHILKSFSLNKVSLSCFDDKRYILDDGINSYAYGHYRIKEAGD